MIVLSCRNIWSGMKSLHVNTVLPAKTLLAATLLCGIVAGCQSESIKPQSDVQSLSSDGLTLVTNLPAPANTRNGADQLISENDVLEIDVFQVDDLDKTVQVDSSGRFSMPLIGAVTAKGKTVSALERELESKYGANYLQSPDITVFVKESAGQQMTLDGEFVRPGIYPTTANSTLLQAVAQGAGLTEISDDKKIYVFREFDGEKLVANYSLSDIRQGKRQDPRVYGGDIVVAFPSKTKVAAQNLRQALGSAVSVSRVAAVGF